MSTERVDKGWVSRGGLEAYSTAAILGTLNHYGVGVTEASFVEAAKADFPLAIAMQWHERWKATGQFTRFPAAAAEELWRRLNAGEIAPTDVALALVNLCRSLDDALDGKPDDGTWDTRFKVVEAYLPRLPPPSERREKFIAEMAGALHDWLEVFDGMAEALARKGQLAMADRFVAIEETLFPTRKGIATALVRIARGELEGGLADLEAIAADASRDPFDRIGAIDGLLEHGKLDLAKRFTLELLDRAEQDKNVELASDVVERLTRLLRADPDRSDRHELRARVEKLSKALEG
ncbi:MAG: hypothetical protein ACOZQL_35275 [Myxococcota bacterium]